MSGPGALPATLRSRRCSLPLGFENSFAILIRDDQARPGPPPSLQLAPHTPQWARAVSVLSFFSRPDGVTPALARLYGLRLRKRPERTWASPTGPARGRGGSEFAGDLHQTA